MSMKHGIVMAAILLVTSNAFAQDGKTKYPSMASLEQYLIADRDSEISLARSAAPESISENADILILSRQGYGTAVEGTNGFVCVVER